MPPPEMIEDYGHTYGSHSEMSVVPEMIEDYRDTYPEVTGELPADDTFVGFHGGILSRFGKAVMRLFLFPGDGTYYPSDYGVVDPSGTINSQPAIQAAIDAAADAGGGVVSLPASATLRLNKPLIVPGGVVLRGNYATLHPYYCGYCVYVLGTHTPLTLGAALCTGSPGSLVCGPGVFDGLSLQSDRFMNLSDWDAFTVEGFIKTDSSPINGAVLYSGVEIAGVPHTGFALFALADGTLRIVWDNVNHDTASGVLPNNTIKFFSINFDGTNVKLYLGTPGGSATQVLSFTAGTATVPCYGGGIEGMWLGSVASGPFGGTSVLGYGNSFKGSLDGVHFSFVARRSGTFTAPTTQPEPDIATLLIPVFSTDGPFIVGKSGHYTRVDYSSSNSYFLPHLAESDSTDSRIENIYCSPGASSYGSGICVYDGVATHLTGVKTHPNGWNGIVLLGTTYASAILDCAAHALSFGWVQAGQSMSTKLLGLDATGATPFYAFGPVGGFYGGVYLNPTSNTRIGLWISQTYSVSFYWCQFDDEGATTDNLVASVLIDNAVVGLNGGLIQHQHTDKPAIQCSRAGTVKCSSDLWVAVIDGTTEVIKFTSAPVQNAVFPGTLFTGNYTNLTTTPQYADYAVPHQGTLSMSGNHTGQSVADCEYLLVSTSSDGQILRGLTPGKHKGIINAGSHTLVLSHQDSSAYAASYRFAIPGASNLILLPSQTATIVRDTTAARNNVYLPNSVNVTEYTTAGSFTFDATNREVLLIECYGPGGGGATEGSDPGDHFQGGGGGGYARGTPVDQPTSLAIVVGAGGAANTTTAGTYSRATWGTESSYVSASAGQCGAPIQTGAGGAGSVYGYVSGSATFTGGTGNNAGIAPSEGGGDGGGGAGAFSNGSAGTAGGGPGGTPDGGNGAPSSGGTADPGGGGGGDYAAPSAGGVGKVRIRWRSR